jgi:hypothetical protein
MPFQYQWIAAKQFWHDDKKRQKRKCTECQVDFNWSTSTGNRLKHSLSHSSLEPAIRQGSTRIVGTAPSNPTPPTQSVIVIDGDSKEEKSDDRSTAPALAVLPKPKSQKNERQITSMLSRVAAKKNDAVYCQEKWNSEHYQLVLQAWLDDKQDKTQLKDFTAALRSLVAQRFPIQAALPAHDAEMNSHSGDQSSSVSH